MRGKTSSGLEQSRKASGRRRSGLQSEVCVGSGLEKRAISKGLKARKLEASRNGFLAPMATLMPFPVIAQALW